MVVLKVLKLKLFTLYVGSLVDTVHILDMALMFQVWLPKSLATRESLGANLLQVISLQEKIRS